MAAELKKLEITFAGLSLAVTRSNDADSPRSTAEVALLNPSPAHAELSDLKSLGNHIPLLIVRKSSVDEEEIQGPDERFPIETAVNVAWLDGAHDPSDFIGWSLQGCVVWALDDMPAEGETGVRFDDSAIQFDVTDPGCNHSGDWASLQWVPTVNALYPALRLAEHWRRSPHVASRFICGKGVLQGQKPLEVSTEKVKIRFPGATGIDTRVYSDAIKYRTETTRTVALVIDRGQSRTVVPFKSPDGNDPVRAWMISLDDQRHSPASFDHFGVYSLLPWRLKNPRQEGHCDGAHHTHGECFNLRYSADND